MDKCKHCEWRPNCDLIICHKSHGVAVRYEAFKHEGAHHPAHHVVQELNLV